MLIIQYNHPLHGEQELKCKELRKKDGLLHVKNKHGVTFQTLDANRIYSVVCVEDK